MDRQTGTRAVAWDRENNVPLPCDVGGGEHRVEIHTEPRPDVVYCKRCGKKFVRDGSWRQGYRPADD